MLPDAAATRRRRLPRSEREQQILEVAHACFGERGYAATTMDEVAATVGVTKPLLYNYWGNKERLYLACLAADAARLQATVAAAVGASSGPADALESGVRAFFRFVDADRGAFRVLFDETLPAGGEVGVRIAEYRAGITALIAGTLLDQMPPQRRAKARTEVEALSHALLGAAESLARWWLLAGTDLPADQAADLLITTVAPGLRARTARGEATRKR